MATTSPGTTGTPSTGTTTSQGLADWAAPYITNYLGKAQALGETPYEAYKGPLTAGASDIQTNLFSGIGGLSLPGNFGKSFTDEGVSQQYMNPYLQQALQPQLEEQRRQAQINLQPSLAKLTQAGGFGVAVRPLWSPRLNAICCLSKPEPRAMPTWMLTTRQWLNSTQNKVKAKTWLS